MAGPRRQKSLYCHFCGQKSKYKFDGILSQFPCAACEAVNYLDENGEITDPPVSATTSSSAPLRFVSERRSVSPGLPPPPTSSTSIFCAKCLENQHMLTSVLAQYFPDDPDDPEYEEREKNYYSFRKANEARYPQVCDECRPKVEAQLRQAGYTAKTDHLRRVMARSKDHRSTAAKSWLDYLHAAGRALWVLGLVLQLLWHVETVASIIGEPIKKARGLLPMMARALPSADTISYYSLAASVASLWWNPRFVQTARGFTKHVVGLPNWYMLQAVIIVSRFVFVQIAAVKKGGEDNGLTRLLALHTGMALIMIYIYNVASHSVTIDTTPLFGRTSSAAPTPEKKRPQPSSYQNSPPKQPQSLSQILDDVLAAPAAAPSSPVSPALHFAPPAAARQPARPTFGAPQSRPRPGGGGGFNSMNLDSIGLGNNNNNNSDFRPSNPQQPADSDEMDWAPTASTPSPHPAINPFARAQQQLQQQQHVEPLPFGAPGINGGFGALRNALGQPSSRPGSSMSHTSANAFSSGLPPASAGLGAQQSRASSAMGFSSSFAAAATGTSVAGRTRDSTPAAETGTSIFGRKHGEGEDGGGLNIKPPRFFAPHRGHDPTGQLSDMFGQSFSLRAEVGGGDEETESEDEGTAVRRQGFVGGAGAGGVQGGRGQRRGGGGGKGKKKGGMMGGLAEVAVLVSMLAGWVHVVYETKESDSRWQEVLSGYTREVMGGMMVGCFVMALGSVLRLRATTRKPTSKANGGGGDKGRKVPLGIYVGVLAGVLEMGVACYCGWGLWEWDGTGMVECAAEGVGLLGGLVAHRVFGAFL